MGVRFTPCSLFTLIILQIIYYNNNKKEINKERTTMKHDVKNCELYETYAECWKNFSAKNYRDVSDFESWAMRKAFHLMKFDKLPLWCWNDGSLIAEYVEDCTTTEYYELSLTDNGILFLRVYDKDYEQTEQYVIKMDME